MATTQYGIRIQRRESGAYRDFVFDQYNGNTSGPGGSKVYLPMLTIKADRTAWFKSHGDLTNTWAGSDAIHATGAVKTTDANTTTLAAITLVDGRAYNITARVVGRKSDGSDRAFYWRAVLAYRQGGVAVIQGGTIVNLATVESTPTGWDCTIDANNNDIRVRVTGVAATVYWVATIEYQSVKDDV